MTEPTTRDEKIAALEAAARDETDDDRRRDLEEQLDRLRGHRDDEPKGNDNPGPPGHDPDLAKRVEQIERQGHATDDPPDATSASFQSGESSSDSQASIAQLEQAAVAGDVQAGQARNVAPGTSTHTVLANLEGPLGDAVRDALAGPHASQVRRAIAELNHWAPGITAVLTGHTTDDETYADEEPVGV